MVGYSGTPLVKKLGIQEGSKVFLAGAPENYLKWVAPLPKAVTISPRMSSSADLVHLFCTEKSQLQKLLRACLDKLKRQWRDLGLLAEKGIQSDDRYHRRQDPRNRVTHGIGGYQSLRCR